MLGVAAWVGLSTGGNITGAFITGGVITGVFTMEGGLRGRGRVGPETFLAGVVTTGPGADIGLGDCCCCPMLSRILGNREIRFLVHLRNTYYRA